MHIVGLLGMTRRIYTYQAGEGWAAYNLAETIGSYILAAGLLLILVNLAVSLRRGPVAGPNPWHAPTLEWTTSSPPPEFNFAVVPRVRSAYPVWEPGAERELVFDEGHQMAETTVRDAELDRPVDLPAESPWPLLVALPLTLAFVMLLTSHWVAAGVAAGLAALAVAAWHLQEPT
jgi:cytochrome c oxidase subunit 1/cytochrome c oxidase subunit I+III